MNRLAWLAIAAATTAPALAQAQPLSVAGVVTRAPPLIQIVMLGLIGATLAAIVLCVAKLVSGPRLSGGSAFLSGLRLGGPVAGLLGAAWSAMSMAIGIANAAATPPARVLAPGAAEIMLLVTLGLFSGAVAVIGHWAVESRIDRAVLTP